MRAKKTIGSTATNYYYDSNNNLIGLKSGTDVVFFYYDADNSPVSMKYSNNMYYYVKNLQGDIVKILDSNGSAVASYNYDAWGTITGKTVTNTTIDTLSLFYLSITTKPNKTFRKPCEQKLTGLFSYPNFQFVPRMLGRKDVFLLVNAGMSVNLRCGNRTVP